MTEYADSLRSVLVRKINKAERDLSQLKLDYCRFVFGLSHRTRVIVDGRQYQVRSVDVDSMERLENDQFGKPQITGILLDGNLKPVAAEPVDLGREWTVG